MLFFSYLLKHPNGQKILNVVLGVLSCAMIFFSFNYSFISGIEGPQTSMFNQIDTIKSIVFSITPSAKFYYQGFFITDFLWPLSLLAVIGLYFKSHLDKIGIPNTNRVFLIWFLIGMTAYGLDVCENIQYLNTNCCLNIIVPLKKAFYAMSLVVPLIVAYVNSESDFLSDFIKFIRSAYISLIIIALIALLMAFIPQGVTIMIHLLESPFNFIASIFLINFLSVLVSHYPVYVGFAINKNFTEKYDLGMSKHNFLGLGIIIYFTKKYHESKVVGINSSFKKYNRYLGVILLCIWSCALIIAAESYVNFGIELLSIFFLLLALSFFYYNHRSAIKEKISARRDSLELSNEEEFKSTLDDIISFCKTYKFLLIVFIVLLLVSTYNVFAFGWSRQTLSSAILLSLVNIAFYIEFRLARSFCKYLAVHPSNRSVFAQPTKDCLMSRDIPEPKPFDLAYFIERKDHALAMSHTAFKWLSRFSDNQFYIKSFRAAGIITFVYLFTANLLIDSVASWASAINVILSFLIIAYSVVVILLKHWIFYRYEFVSQDRPLNELASLKKYAIYYSKYLPISLVLLVAILSISRSYLNRVHELNLIPQGPELCFDDYVSAHKLHKDSSNQYMSIASDGGGLKANLWNLLVLNENPQLIDQSFLMSGVSGGSMGIANYLNLLQFPTKERDSIIDQIGNANILAIDASGLLLRDYIMSYTRVVNKDRSFYGMWQYAKSLGMDKQDFINKPYRSQWLDIYNQRHTKLPMLNINASSTTYKQGYALSVCHSDETIPASIDMVGFPAQDTTISYYNAVSTSNRFPLASPAAKILGKGYFVDGGYFENSGILAAENIFHMLKKELLKQDSTTKAEHKVLNIRNGKSDWVKAFMKHHRFDPDSLRLQIRETQEIGAMINTLVNLDKKPMALRERREINDPESIDYIFMPHLIHLSDIESAIGGNIKVSHKLMEAIHENNMQIKKVLRVYQDYNLDDWGIVMPPLARLLSNPGVKYEFAMANAGVFTPALLEDY